MQIIPLTTQEMASSGMTHKLVITGADVAALTSGTAASIFPGFNGALTFPANCVLMDAVGIVKTPFTGGAGTLTFGVSDGTNQILATGQDLTTASFAGYNLTKPVAYAAAGKISITVTSQNAIANWTQGELDVYLAFVDYNLLNR